MDFYEKVKVNIHNLIECKITLKQIYSQDEKYKKNVNQLTFKISNYKKWLGLLETKKDKITTYITVALKKKIPIKAIKQQLLKAGFNEKVINDKIIKTNK